MNDGTTNPLEAESKLEELIEFVNENFDFYKSCIRLADCPIITKQNYIEKYSIQERSVDILKIDFIHSSSGSTGSPTIWPRSTQDEQAISSLFERILVSLGLSKTDSKATLAVVCFPMSVWVGGLFTTFCLRILSQKGYPLTIVTPGNNVEETFKILRATTSLPFKQTVLFGYTLMVKVMIDKGVSNGFDWESLNLALVLAGEVFSEEFREILIKRASITHASRIVSIYGSADAGVIASETPFSIKIRRFLASNPDLAKELFKSDRFPSFFQYDPITRYLEQVEEKILVTVMPLGDEMSNTPLIRYEIGDHGGVMDCFDVMEFLKNHGLDLRNEEFDKLPFTWVFGRLFWAISLFGANVFVDNIMVGLESPDVNTLTTGKFVLGVKENLDDCRLKIHVELAQDVALETDQSIPERFAASILKQLLRLNSEFANFVPKEQQMPIVVTRLFGDPSWFPIGVKHKYIK